MIILKELVHSSNPFTPFLFLTHTTTVYSFKEIIIEKKISKKKCKVFDEELVYLFYGRPDYTPNKLSDNHNVVAQMPVTILLKWDAFSSFYRIAPFDTGAFINNFFDDVFPKQDTKENLNLFNKDYSLAISADTPAKLITLFYSNNKNFIKGTFSPDDSINQCLEARNCKDLAAKRSNSKYDGRNTAIELQVNQDIPLDPSLVEIIYLPEDCITMFDSDLNSLNVKFNYYPPGPLAPTSESMGKIKTLIYQYYQAKQMI